MIEIGNFSKHYYDKAVDLLKRLTVIPAPSGKEDKRAEFIISYLKDEGIENAYIDEAKNVILPYNDDGKTKLDVFAAHTDVVFPDLDSLPLKIEGTKYSSPGIGDNTAHVVAILMYVSYFFKERVKTKRGVLFVLNSTEEGLGNLLGVRTLFKNYGDRIATFSSFDATIDKGIMNKAVGSERYSIRVKTKGGHSYKNFGEKNAIAEISSIICDLYSLEAINATYNVGTITGGTSVNTIAENAECTYEFRSTDLDALKRMRSLFKEVIDKHQKDDVKISIEEIGVRPCGIETDTKDLEAIAERAISRYHYPINRTTSSTDCNIPLSIGIPAICIGLIKITGSHTREEFVDIESYRKGLDIGYEYIKELCCVL